MFFLYSLGKLEMEGVEILFETKTRYPALFLDLSLLYCKVFNCVFRSWAAVAKCPTVFSDLGLL